MSLFTISLLRKKKKPRTMMSVRFVMKSFVKASRASVADLYPTIGSRQSRARTNDYYRSAEVPMSKFFSGDGGGDRTGAHGGL